MASGVMVSVPRGSGCRRHRRAPGRQSSPDAARSTATSRTRASRSGVGDTARSPRTPLPRPSAHGLLPLEARDDPRTRLRAPPRGREIPRREDVVTNDVARDAAADRPSQHLHAQRGAVDDLRAAALARARIRSARADPHHPERTRREDGNEPQRHTVANAQTDGRTTVRRGVKAHRADASTQDRVARRSCARGGLVRKTGTPARSS